MANTNRYLSIAIVGLLLVAMGYYYLATSEEISSLKSNARSACQELTQLVAVVPSLLGNVTTALRTQVQADKSLIENLNSTKPSGYVQMIASLNDEIDQDNAILNSVSNQFQSNTALSGYSGPCSAFDP